MLQVRDVAKSFDGYVAVDRVSFEVQPGEIFALLGPNGAGKTTLIRMITDILEPDAGEILWEGRPSRERDPGALAYLPEERGLYRRSRVVDMVAFYGELKGLKPRQARADAGRLLERVELGGWADKQVQALSKGMQQKVQLCAALIGTPRLLILDEPFSGLDPINVQLLEQILQEARSGGATVMLSTHQMNKVEELCDRALMIHHGRTVLYGAVRQIRREHADHAVLVRTQSRLSAVPGVRSIEAFDGDQKLILEANATPQDVLHALVDQGVEIESFALATLPLEDVFVKVVRQGGEEPPPRSPAVPSLETASAGARGPR